MNLKTFLSFAIGAATGSVATYILLKKKFEKKYQEDLQSVKDKLGARNNKPEEPKEVQEFTEQDYKEYYDIIVENGYSEKAEPVSKVYVITPEEFAEDERYTVASLTYFAGDGVLADENGDEIIINLIGKESLHHFGDYEENVVHVRNEHIGAEYEVILDERSYSEVYPDKDE